MGSEYEDEEVKENAEATNEEGEEVSNGNDDKAMGNAWGEEANSQKVFKEIQEAARNANKETVEAAREAEVKSQKIQDDYWKVSEDAKRDYKANDIEDDDEANNDWDVKAL